MKTLTPFQLASMRIREKMADRSIFSIAVVGRDHGSWDSGTWQPSWLPKASPAESDLIQPHLAATSSGGRHKQGEEAVGFWWVVPKSKSHPRKIANLFFTVVQVYNLGKQFQNRLAHGKNFAALGDGLAIKSCPTLTTPWTIAHWGPLSMRFSRQEYWSELLFPSPGDLCNRGIAALTVFCPPPTAPPPEKKTFSQLYETA